MGAGSGENDDRTTIWNLTNMEGREGERTDRQRMKMREREKL